MKLKFLCYGIFICSYLSCNYQNISFKECEDIIVNKNDYHGALKLYLENFNNYNKKKLYVSTRHINNALICAVEEKDTSIIKILSREMRNRGADKKYFKRLKINFEENILGHKPLEFISYKNDKMRSELDSMLVLDQKYREEGTFDSLKYADSVNYLKLKLILKSYGYPKEEMVGSWINDGYLISNPVEIIILHNLQQNNKELAKMLYERFLKNEIDEFVFSKYYSYGFTMNVKEYQEGFLFCRLYDIPLLDIDDKIYQVKCPTDLPKIDSLRLKFKMDSYETMIKKVSLRLCKDFHFYDPVPFINRYSGGGDEILKNDINNLTKMECNL